MFRKILPISDLEHAAFDFIYERMLRDEESLGIDINYIYLDTPAEQCFERVNRRARPEERTIDLDYLKQLEDRYAVLKDNSIIVNGAQRQEQVLQDF